MNSEQLHRVNLAENLKTLRRHGFKAMINNAETLLTAMGCKGASRDKKAAFFVTLVNRLIADPSNAEILLASLGLLAGYEDIKGVNDRRLKYYENGYPDGLWKKPTDSLANIEDRAIDELIDKIVAAKDLSPVLAGTPAKFSPPTPQYYSRRPRNKDNPPKIDIVLDGVNDANGKLDEMAKLTSRLDRFDNIADAQASAGINAFVYSLIGGISGINPIEYECMAQEIKDELNNQLTRAVLNRLPEADLDAFEELLDDDDVPAEVLLDFFQNKAAANNLDLTTITFDTMARFAELYKQSADIGGETRITETPGNNSDTLPNVEDCSDDELDEELFAVIEDIIARPSPQNRSGAITRVLVEAAGNRIKERNFMAAFEELKKVRENVPEEDIDDDTIWLTHVLVVKLQRSLDECDKIKERANRADYSDVRRQRDILLLKSLLIDCPDNHVVKKLLTELESV